MDDNSFIVNFCGITGSNIDIALSYMEMSNGDLDTAISLFFDNNEESGKIYEKDMEVEESDSDAYDREKNDDNHSRVLELDEIYRPQGVEEEHHSVSLFPGDSHLNAQYDLPDNLKGPYVLEVARDKALYSDNRKWVFLCIFEQNSLLEIGQINNGLFHDQNIIEVMEANFIIVQQLVNIYSYQPEEGNRLSNIYHVSRYPFVAIINPLTGSVERQIYESTYSNRTKFFENITGFLMYDTLTTLPMIPAPSIDMQTSDRVTPITPAKVKPLPKDTSSHSPSKSNTSRASHINPVLPFVERDISIQPGPNACRIRLRLPSGVSNITVYKNAKVKELVVHIKKITGLETFDLLCGNPPSSFINNSEKTLDELGLNGTAIIVRQV